MSEHETDDPAPTANEIDNFGRYATIAQIRTANKAAGHFWFTPDTMRFFDTRFESLLIAGCLFITSEQPPDGPRVYSLRVATRDGHVNTYGDFGHLATYSEALDNAHQAARDIGRAT